jgi:hypothetical protein
MKAVDAAKVNENCRLTQNSEKTAEVTVERNLVNLKHWRKGQSGNPRGRPRGPRTPNIRAVLAPHGKFLAEAAVGLVDDAEAPVSLRIVALQLCFEYLWGKPQEGLVDDSEEFRPTPKGPPPPLPELQRIAKGALGT